MDAEAEEQEQPGPRLVYEVAGRWGELSAGDAEIARMAGSGLPVERISAVVGQPPSYVRARMVAVRAEGLRIAAGWYPERERERVIPEAAVRAAGRMLFEAAPDIDIDTACRHAMEMSIDLALAAEDGNKAAAARRLGLNRTTLVERRKAAERRREQ